MDHLSGKFMLIWKHGEPSAVRGRIQKNLHPKRSKISWIPGFLIKNELGKQEGRKAGRVEVGARFGLIDHD
jgi:hypothetical protein